MKKEIAYLSILFVSCSLFISSCSKSKVDTTVSKREKAAEEMDELDVTVSSSYYAQSLNGTTSSANQNTHKNSSTSNSETNRSKKTKTQDPITPSNSVEGENGSGSGVGNSGSISGADTVKIK